LLTTLGGIHRFALGGLAVALTATAVGDEFWGGLSSLKEEKKPVQNAFGVYLLHNRRNISIVKVSPKEPTFNSNHL
jgi:hypothetical protein